MTVAQRSLPGRRDRRTPTDPRQIGTQAAVGAVAGLIATLAMDRTQHALTTRFPPPAPPPGVRREDPPPVRMATTLVHVVGHRTIADENKARAAAVVSYVFGAAIGAGYAMLAAYLPPARLGRGTLFGVALWLGGDVVSAPLLGVADSLATTPRRVAAIDAVGHVVFGLATESVRAAAARTR